MFLSENSLYTSPAELASLVTDKTKVANVFYLNFLGTLGLMKIDDKAGAMVSYIAQEKKLRPNTIGDDNNDVSLVVKLALDAGIIKQPAAVMATKLLVLIKTKKVRGADINDDLVRDIIRACRIQTNRPAQRIYSAVSDFVDAKATLQQTAAALHKISKLPDFTDITKEFRDLITRGGYISDLLKLGTPSGTVAPSTVATPAPAQAAPTHTTHVTHAPLAIPARVARSAMPPDGAQTGSDADYMSALMHMFKMRTVGQGYLNRFGFMLGFDAKRFIETVQRPDFVLAPNPHYTWDKHPFATYVKRQDVNAYNVFVKAMKDKEKPGIAGVSTVGAVTTVHNTIATQAAASAPKPSITMPAAKAPLLNEDFMKEAWAAGTVAAWNAVRTKYAMTYDYIFRNGAIAKIKELTNANIPQTYVIQAQQALSVSKNAKYSESRLKLDSPFLRWMARESDGDGSYYKNTLPKYILDISILDAAKKTDFKKWLQLVYYYRSHVELSYIFRQHLQMIFGDMSLRIEKLLPYILDASYNLWMQQLPRSAYSGDGIEVSTAELISSIINDGSLISYTLKLQDKYGAVKANYNFGTKTLQLADELAGTLPSVEVKLLEELEKRNQLKIDWISPTEEDVAVAELRKYFFRYSTYTQYDQNAIQKLANAIPPSSDGALKVIEGLSMDQILRPIDTERMADWIYEVLKRDKQRLVDWQPNYFYNNTTAAPAPGTAEHFLEHLLTSGYFSKLDEMDVKFLTNLMKNTNYYNVENGSKLLASGDQTLIKMFGETASVNRIIWAMKGKYHPVITYTSVEPTKWLENFLSDEAGSKFGAECLTAWKKAHPEFKPDIVASSYWHKQQMINSAWYYTPADKEWEEAKGIVYANQTPPNQWTSPEAAMSFMEFYNPAMKALYITKLKASASTSMASTVEFVKYAGKEDSSEALITTLKRMPATISSSDWANRSEYMHLIEAVSKHGDFKFTTDAKKKILRAYVDRMDSLKTGSLPKDIINQINAAFVDILMSIKDEEKVFANQIFSEARTTTRNLLIKNVGQARYFDLIKDELYKYPIKPETQLDAAKIRTILKYNNLQMAVPTSRKEVKTLDDIDKSIVKGVSDVGKLKIEETNMSDEDHELMTLDIHSKRNSNHGDFAIKVLKTYNVNFPGSQQRVDAFKAQYPNAQVLPRVFHGTGSIAASMILRNGFVIVPTNGAVATAGRMLGNGIYFSDVSNKAAQYVSDDAFGRRYGTRGYLFEMEAALGEPFTHHRSAGFSGATQGSGAVSPEWAVFKPKDQLRIYKVHHVELVPMKDIDALKAKHPKKLNEGTRMSFENYLKEREQPKAGTVSTFLFMDGMIPVDRETVVDWDAYKAPSNVKLVPSADGIVVEVYHSEDIDPVMVRIPHGRVWLDSEGEQRELFFRLIK